jgi:Coenzyme PQQ synthesis protein D (PqqD)
MAEKTTLAAEDVITHGEEQVFTIVDGEAVLMSVANGKYYKLDDIGTRVWSLIETPTALSAVCDQLTQEFQVDPATCEADVRVLLDRLLESNLVRVVPAAQ